MSLDASSVDELIKALDGTFPGLGNRLCDENAKLRRFLNVYVSSEDIRSTTKPQPWLMGMVSIVPAVAGGDQPRPAGLI